MEHQRDHLLSQRGKLRPHGTGIPLLAGTGRVADCTKAEARNRSNCMPGIAIGVFYRLYLERAVPHADYLLGENRLPFPSGTVGVFGNCI